MTEHEPWMRRCIQLARNGAGQVAPNPMVGALLVQGDGILSEGWHRQFGDHHAEVECLRAFGNSPVPEDATMYVSLEPCAHHGRTPPCVDLLIHRQVKRLVVGCGDPNPLTKDKGIARAREAGMDVITDVLRDECRWLNRRFITRHEQQRPYIILKWAQSRDGFLDDHGKSARISSAATDVLVHRWRAEEQAILIGSRTAVNDDPALTVRHVAGRQPLRILLDRTNRTPANARIFDRAAHSLLFTRTHRAEVHVEQVILQESSDPLDALLSAALQKQVNSILVEGGAALLRHFLDRGLWDEARVITGAHTFGGGTAAPRIDAAPVRSLSVEQDHITFHVRENPPPDPWCW